MVVGNYSGKIHSSLVNWSMIGPRPWVAETFSWDSAFNSTQEIEWYLNPTWK